MVTNLLYAWFSIQGLTAAFFAVAWFLDERRWYKK